MKKIKIKSTKEEMLELGTVMVDFWKGFHAEVLAIPPENEIDLYMKWSTYFKENVDSIHKLIDVRQHMDNIEACLIMRGELHYEN